MVLSMNKENAIEVNNITKSFKVYYDKGSELKEKMLFWKRNKYEMRQVLKGIRGGNWSGRQEWLW